MNYAEWSDWYDLFYSTESGEEVDFYLEKAVSSDGAVLEIGVGTGRIAIPAAAKGVEVVGVDASQEMLAVAAQKAESAGPLAGSVTLISADMRSLDLRRHDFKLVMIPARTLLLALTHDDQMATLCSAARHVAPGGRLIFNLFNPTADLVFDESVDPIDIGEVEHPSNGNRFRLSAVNRFETESQINHAEHIVEEILTNGSTVEKARLPVTLRYLYPHQVFEMLEETNLSVENVYGWFDESAFDENSEEMIFVSRKK